MIVVLIGKRIFLFLLQSLGASAIDFRGGLQSFALENEHVLFQYDRAVRTQIIVGGILDVRKNGA